MKTWKTKIIAVCPETGNVEEYSGPYVKGATMNCAQMWSNDNGFGYVFATVLCNTGLESFVI